MNNDSSEPALHNHVARVLGEGNDGVANTPSRPKIPQDLLRVANTVRDSMTSLLHDDTKRADDLERALTDATAPTHVEYLNQRAAMSYRLILCDVDSTSAAALGASGDFATYREPK